MPDPRRELGRIAETAAAEYLKDRGFKILETNYRKRTGEIDIIARKDNCVHFIEIKSQSETSEFPAIDGWSDAQRDRFIWLVEQYLAENVSADGAEALDVSLDFIEVIIGDGGSVSKIRLIEDALRPD
jgi:putative endonuclease